MKTTLERESTRRRTMWPYGAEMKFTDEQAQHVVAQIKNWMEAGYTIRAEDPKKVLEPQADGSIYGGLHIKGDDCPQCDNSGRLMPDGDQCEWCYREPNSEFNRQNTKADTRHD